MNVSLPEGSVVGAGGVALHDAAEPAQIVRVVGHVVAAVKVRWQHERQAHDPLDHHAGLRLQLQTQHSTVKASLFYWATVFTLNCAHLFRKCPHKQVYLIKSW